MDSAGSITRCIRDLENGERDDEAARELWERFCGDLRRCSLKRLRSMLATGAVADEEDVALRAFTKVWVGIKRGQLKVEGRIDLWKLLRWGARCEAINQAGRRPKDLGVGGSGGGEGPENLPAGESTPVFLMLAEEGCRRLLDLLGEELLRRIALWKLVGHTSDEIARKLGCSIAKVERKLAKIRAAWAEVAPAGPTRPGPRNASGADVADDLGGTTAILRGMDGRLE